MAQNVAPLKDDKSPVADAPGFLLRFKRWAMVLALLLLGIFIILIVYFVFLRQTSSTLPVETEGDTTPVTNETEMRATNLPPVFSDPMEFQVNLLDGRRYLALSMRMALLDQDVLTYVNLRTPVVKDIVLTTLSRKTYESLRSSDGVDQLKKDLVRRLNSGKIFTTNFLRAKKTNFPIQDVYFEKFVLQ